MGVNPLSAPRSCDLVNLTSSPRTWGWTDIARQVEAQRSQDIVPTHVGVNRLLRYAERLLRYQIVPTHVGVNQSHRWLTINVTAQLSSPRTWGEPHEQSGGVARSC